MEKFLIFYQNKKKFVKNEKIFNFLLKQRSKNYYIILL